MNVAVRKLAQEVANTLVREEKVMVHCLSGRGRTGTLITAAYGILNRASSNADLVPFPAPPSACTHEVALLCQVDSIVEMRESTMTTTAPPHCAYRQRRFVTPRMCPQVATTHASRQRNLTLLAPSCGEETTRHLTQRSKTLV